MVVDYSKIEVNRREAIDEGIVVWVRLDSWPWWPAVVVNRKLREPDVELDDGEQLPDESDLNRMVEFFHDDGRVAVVPVLSICEFTSNMKLVRQSGKPRKDVVSACREANNFIETQGRAEQKQRYSKLMPFEDYIKPRHKQSKYEAGASSDMIMDDLDDDDEENENGRSEIPIKRKRKYKRKSESSRKQESSGMESIPRRRNSDIPRKSKKRVDKYESGAPNFEKDERNGSHRNREHLTDDLKSRKSPGLKLDSNYSPNPPVPRLHSSRGQSLSRDHNADTSQTAYRNQDNEHGFDSVGQTKKRDLELDSQAKKIRRRDSENRSDGEPRSMTEKPPRKRHKPKSRWTDDNEREAVKREPVEESKSSKKNLDSVKRPRAELFSESDSDDSFPVRLPRRDNKTAYERKDESETSDDDYGSQMEPIDSALAKNLPKTEDVAAGFDRDIRVGSEAKPESRIPTCENLTNQINKFQIALLKYHDDLVEIEYYRKLELGKLNDAKQRREELIIEIEKLKKEPVSRETLLDTGALDVVRPFVNTLKGRTPRLVEDMTSLADHWESFTKVEKFRSKPAPNPVAKSVNFKSVRDNEKPERKTEKRKEESKKTGGERNDGATRSSPKSNNFSKRVKEEEMSAGEEEISGGKASVGVKKESVLEKRDDSFKSADEKLSDTDDIPLTNDVVPTDVESMKESRVALRAKAFNPQTCMKALSVLVKGSNPNRSSSEVDKMTELVEKEIRDFANDDQEYYSISVKVIKALKNKSNLDKVWTTNSAREFF